MKIKSENTNLRNGGIHQNIKFIPETKGEFFELGALLNDRKLSYVTTVKKKGDLESITIPIEGLWDCIIWRPITTKPNP